MPFTLTHTLAVLPIARMAWRRLPFSALIIGSMIPDLPMFFSQVFSYDEMHAPLGLFRACLPAGLVVFLVFQWVMKEPLFAVLPAWIQARCPNRIRDRIRWSPSSIVWSALAIVIGAATHQVWDAFTHHGRWGTRLFPVLEQTVFSLGSYPVAGYKVVQYGSSLIGLPLLGILLGVWLVQQPARPIEPGESLSAPWKWEVGLALVGNVAIIAVMASQGTNFSAYQALGWGIRTWGRIMIVLTLAACVVYQTKHSDLFQ